MIKEIKVYTFICDRCGADIAAGTEYCGFSDLDAFDLDDDGGKVIDGKHYCPNCWTVNDNDEEVVKP